MNTERLKTSLTVSQMDMIAGEWKDFDFHHINFMEKWWEILNLRKERHGN